MMQRTNLNRWVILTGGLVLVALALVTFHPGLRMGFYLDDYIYVERAGRTDWSNALAQIFDPRIQTLWYRPLQAVQFFVEFQLFGGDANLYHLVNMAYHGVNTLLLYGLVWRISQTGNRPAGKWLLGWISAFFYATFPVYASGINWIGIVDPLTGMFFLLSIWFWWSYLEKPNRLYYCLTFAAFILALACKQISIMLPIILFLVEWWLHRDALSIPRMIRRYGPFVVGAVAFSAVQYLTQSTHTFAGVFGWQLGTTMAFILLQYLVLFFFPYGIFPSIDYNPTEVGTTLTYAWTVVAIFTLVWMGWSKRSRVLLFLGVFTLLTLLPVLPFPFIEHRYLYIPILSSAVLLGLLFEQARRRWGRRVWFTSVAAIMLALLVVGDGLAVNTSALEAAEWARQLRVPYRDIERQHATLAPDTLLYFIDPITPTTGGLGGMFFLRYGRQISVKNWTERADFYSHNVSYIYYFDEARRPRELPVHQGAVTSSSIPLPAEYNAPIRLEGYEISTSAIRKGEPLVIVLYWRSLGKIDRRLTAFVHLLDPAGRVVAGYDSEPRKGQAPTDTWEPQLSYADAVVLPVGTDVPVGTGYSLKVGLYDARTQERLQVIDAQGKPLTDVIRIEPLGVIEQGTNAARN